jgi:hypothetical protein
MMPRNDPFQSDVFRKIQLEYLSRILSFLLEEGVEFAVAAEVEYLGFEPELPREIHERFSPVSLFVLTGYTYETARIDGESLLFEAGFGEENFGSLVSVPLLAVKQVIVGEYPVAINIAEPSPETEVPDASHSMEALLNNPENLKLLKKKKKR